MASTTNKKLMPVMVLKNPVTGFFIGKTDGVMREMPYFCGHATYSSGDAPKSSGKYLVKSYGF